MTMNTTVNIFSENSSHTTSRSASNNSYQVCEMTADSAAEITAKAVAYFFIFLVSFFGNISILVVIYKNKRLRRSINYFVFNMAVSDLFNPLTVMTMTTLRLFQARNPGKSTVRGCWETFYANLLTFSQMFLLWFLSEAFF